MRFARLFLACLLAVAIPLQGIAAASMPACTMGQQDDSTMFMEAQPSHDSVEAGAADGDQAKHGMHDMDAKPGAAATCCQAAMPSDDLHVPGMQPVPQGIVSSAEVILRTRATPPPDKPPRA
jgi:hypothetical protein